MKNFGSLMLAAIIGSVFTITATQWMGEKDGGVKIEHISGVPISQVAYAANAKGEMVPLDFTGTAEKVTKAVVHIRSTQTVGPNRKGQPEIPEQFRQFFSLNQDSRDQVKVQVQELSSIKTDILLPTIT